jgi:predicted glutamine amidotransferase
MTLPVCRLFGLHSGRDPVRARFWLLDAPGALVSQSCVNPDGFGIGTFEPDGSPDVDKEPVRAQGAALYAREAAEECSRTYVAHVRAASIGALTHENTHPFEQDGRLFAHNGVVGFGPDEPADPALVHGETDSERLFARITLAIREHDGDAGAGIRAAVADVAATVELYSLNFVLTTADDVWALRYPEHNELFLLERRPGGALDDVAETGMRIDCPEAGERPLVVVASERIDDDPRWEPVAPGELVHVDTDLKVTRELILPDPPAHPMVLTGREADSQAQTPG